MDEKINPKQCIAISLVRIRMLSTVWDKEKSEVLSLLWLFHYCCRKAFLLWYETCGFECGSCGGHAVGGYLKYTFISV